MAQKVVQFVIGQILTDEELRANFLDRPVETLIRLREKGLDLTEGEVDAITQTDPRLWLKGANWVDPRLRRSELRPRGEGES